MWKNYQTMKAVKTKGVDKYFHCMANCQAAETGPGGYFAAQVISNLREDFDYWKGDPISASMQDIEANRCGRRSPGRCKQGCSRYIPPWFHP
jgi:serum amyloid A protein